MWISDTVYLLESTRGSYAYLVFGKETVLVDTGFPAQGKAILRELERINVKCGDIRHILLTHYDVDHIGNVAMLENLTGAQVWASKEEIPYIMGTLDRPGFKKYLARFAMLKKPKDIKPYIPGQSIHGIEALPTPGHTPGHVCLLYKDVLFAGDLYKSEHGKLRPYPKPWNWDDKIILESAKKIESMPFRWVCPAHGSPVERK